MIKKVFFWIVDKIMFILIRRWPWLLLSGALYGFGFFSGAIYIAHKIEEEFTCQPREEGHPGEKIGLGEKKEFSESS